MSNKDLTAFVLVLLLWGCGQEDDSNHGLGWHFDVEGATGVKLRYRSTGEPSLEFVEDIYRITQDCIGASAPGPLIVFVSDLTPHASHTEGRAPKASTYLDTGTVVASEQLGITIGNLTMTLAHEFVHWITHWNGLLTVDQQVEHDSPWFQECAATALVTLK